MSLYHAARRLLNFSLRCLRLLKSSMLSLETLVSCLNVDSNFIGLLDLITDSVYVLHVDIKEH